LVVPVLSATSSPHSGQKNGAFDFNAKYAVTISPVDFCRAQSMENIPPFYHDIREYLSELEILGGAD
jgi:hypothetical protein